MPVEDAANLLGNIRYTIPYSPEQKKQFYTGEMLDLINNKKIQAVWQKICSEVLEHESQG